MDERDINTRIIFGHLVIIFTMVGIAITAAASAKYGVSWWIGGPAALIVLIVGGVMAIRGNYR
jgi:hypothetical protein